MIVCGSLDSTRFRLDIFVDIDGDSKDFRIGYESSDGINYTRTDFESGGEPLENPVDLTTPVKWGSRYGEVEWNDLVGYFMIVGSATYEGLYKYNGINTQYELANTQLNTTSEDIYGNKTVYTNIGKVSGTLQNTDNLTLDQLKTRINLYDDLSYLELNENVMDISHMFKSSLNLTSVPNFNTSNVTNMAYTFWNCGNLTSIPNFDTSNVTDMSFMFTLCMKLTNIPNYNTSKVTNMSAMFRCCSNLISIPNFNTVNVTNMFFTFSDCNNLVSVPNFNTVNVTSMAYMFGGCPNLTSVPNFDVSNVIITSNMFLNCFSLTDVPNFNTCNVKSTYAMFENCYNLVDVPQFDTSNVTNMCQMFTYCNSLSNTSIQNIVNMCLNSDVTYTNIMNLNNTNYYSPLYNTKFDNTYYQNRWSELTNAGWTY